MKTRNSFFLLLAGLASLTAWQGTMAQELEDLPYSSGSTGVDGALTIPEASTIGYFFAAAFDADRNEVVVFGGYDASSNMSGNTWVWTPEGGWVQKFPANSPTRRYDSAMAYDAESGQIILYGGYGQVPGSASNDSLADTWVWDGENWTELSPANNAGSRYGHSMAYDSNRKEIVLYGGNESAGDYYSTFIWNGTNWSERTTANNPGYAAPAAMAYDAKNQKVLLFTGWTSTPWWQFDGVDWTQIFPAQTPGSRSRTSIAYDPLREQVVLFDGDYWLADTWVWTGGNWMEKTSSFLPKARYGHQLVSTNTGVLLVGGYGNGGYSRETALWDGTNWTFLSGVDFLIDMAAKPDGIWNYTTIHIPVGVTVRFLKNAANTPVYWLASGTVRIDGIIDISGEDAKDGGVEPDFVAKGGPGGYDGGLGGTRFDVSGSYAGTPGQGPGGGLPGTSPDDGIGQSGEFVGIYGNLYLQPLIGGSGGGGSASSDTSHGANGGAGGGAILIASSRDIIVNGEIRANGGSFAWWTWPNYSGAGSGGAVRLVADRVIGTGNVQATAGSGYNSSNSAGRVRMEGFFRSLAASSGNTPPPSAASPTLTAPIQNLGQLVITSVAGSNVAQPPSGQISNPDVVFTAPGTISVLVTGSGIPDGSPVQLRVASSGSVITTEAVNLSGGTATFSVTVPAGLGTIQAYSTFTQAAPNP
jgi:hypothetical protein